MTTSPSDGRANASSDAGDGPSATTFDAAVAGPVNSSASTAAGCERLLVKPAFASIWKRAARIEAGRVGRMRAGSPLRCPVRSAERPDSVGDGGVATAAAFFRIVGDVGGDVGAVADALAPTDPPDVWQPRDRSACELAAGNRMLAAAAGTRGPVDVANVGAAFGGGGRGGRTAARIIDNGSLDPPPAGPVEGATDAGDPSASADAESGATCSAVLLGAWRPPAEVLLPWNDARTFGPNAGRDGGVACGTNDGPGDAVGVALAAAAAAAVVVVAVVAAA